MGMKPDMETVINFAETPKSNKFDDGVDKHEKTMDKRTGKGIFEGT